MNLISKTLLLGLAIAAAWAASYTVDGLLYDNDGNGNRALPSAGVRVGGGSTPSTKTNLLVDGEVQVGSVSGGIGFLTLSDASGSKSATLQAPDTVTTNNTTLLPDRVLPESLLKTIPHEPGTNQVVNAVENVDYSGPAKEYGAHAAPFTGNPLTPTWNGAYCVVWYGATGTINLPAAGSYQLKGITIYNTGAFTITIDPNGSEIIVRAGVVQTGGVSIVLASGAGNFVSLISDGNRWITLGYTAGSISQGS
jgi:hypothetical protein